MSRIEWSQVGFIGWQTAFYVKKTSAVFFIVSCIECGLPVNAADVVGRAVRSLSGVADEVVLVDAGSSDGTPDVVQDVCGVLGVSFRCVSLSPSTNPELFMRDEPTTWRREVPGHLPDAGR